MSMSIEVPVQDLPQTTGRCGWCFVVTSGPSGAHVLSLSPTWSDAGDAVFSATSGRLAANVGASGVVTMVYPPFADDELEGYSLIVDAEALFDDETSLRCTPLRAVWHRPAPPASK
jgi:hypothetical protein